MRVVGRAVMGRKRYREIINTTICPASYFKTIGLLEGEISGSGEVTSDKVGLP